MINNNKKIPSNKLFINAVIKNLNQPLKFNKNNNFFKLITMKIIKLQKIGIKNHLKYWENFRAQMDIQIINLKI
jgi:hypothetical protein